MTIRTVCVCGAGTMGSGIAQVCAAAGFHTILYELNTEVLQKASMSIPSTLSTLVAKGKMTRDDADAMNARISYTSDVSSCVADLVIEAIVERPDIKAALFTELAAVNGAQTIYASNTSSLSISSLAGSINDPARFAGLHFFNPAPLMKLVEVVAAAQTAPTVIDALTSFTATLGKTPVVCRDAPGFIVNRVARPYYIESLRLAEEGIDLETIDRLLEDRGFRLGPFRLMDLIGNDVNYAVSCSVHAQLGHPERLRPSILQREKVEAGNLGRKTGRGYYDYQ
ncbi:MAG: 3-hydroxybutyryl-CoA dehydrogenase [Flaviaesturariibacter sp.]|nr:3-hydroxybutyryl-CoA dehydrogenase [Flaviaesturariibacter sp.]